MACFSMLQWVPRRGQALNVCCARLLSCRIILTSDIEGVGKTGEIRVVPVGYWRNFLLPNGRAQIASEAVLEWVWLPLHVHRCLQPPALSKPAPCH